MPVGREPVVARSLVVRFGGDPADEHLFAAVRALEPSAVGRTWSIIVSPVCGPDLRARVESWAAGLGAPVIEADGEYDDAATGAGSGTEWFDLLSASAAIALAGQIMDVPSRPSTFAETMA